MVIVPLQECIARPPDGAVEYPLVDHLREVALRAAEGFRQERERSRAGGAACPQGHRATGPSPAPQAAPHLFRLAGLLHDAGKADSRWQEYIRRPDRDRRAGAVPHSYVGAALFFALAWDWLERQGLERVRVLSGLLLRMTSDIACHHGALADLEQQPPWLPSWDGSVASRLDFPGLARLVGAECPGLSASWLEDPTEVVRRVHDMRRVWGKAFLREAGASRRLGLAEVARRCLRVETGRLIAADRFAVAGVEQVALSPDLASEARRRLVGHCRSRSDAVSTKGPGPARLAELRTEAQHAVESAFKRQPDRPLYGLSLATGMGKTLSALRIGLEAVTRGRRRLLYVAPYLSVLSQAAGQIEEATGLPVLQHHHLSEPPRSPDTLTPTERDYLAMESWQAPVVATTFNQFFLSLFPSRAQQTARIPSLEGAFVIVDEPQVMDQEVWARFNVALEAACAQLGMQCLLVSATMPPWQGTGAVHELSPPLVPPDRYELRTVREAWDAERTAAEAHRMLDRVGSVAVILNTIGDAGAVYREVKRRLGATAVSGDGGATGEPKVVLAHGAMTPAHKAHQLARIGQYVAEGTPVLAISTQVLEAGVDLSFRGLLRALPVLPSVTQAAGRANRHGEGEPAEVVVFPFIRRDGPGVDADEGATDSSEPAGQGNLGVDSRPFVYRGRLAREETDALLLGAAERLTEGDLRELTVRYFERLFARKPATGLQALFAEAAGGRWSALAGLGPFQEDRPRLAVFVPRDDWNTPAIAREVRHFSVESARELYELYAKPGWLASLDYSGRRRLFRLMENFIAHLDYERARMVADLNGARGVFLLADVDAYDGEMGFAELVSGQMEAQFW